MSGPAERGTSVGPGDWRPGKAQKRHVDGSGVLSEATKYSYLLSTAKQALFQRGARELDAEGCCWMGQ